MSEEKKTWSGALKYLKATAAGTMLASVGSVYTFDTVEADEFDVNKNGDVQVESLLKDHEVLTKSPFTDVPSSYWASDAIEWGVQNGIIQGYKDGTFKSHGKLTEAQFAAILSRYIGKVEGKSVEEASFDKGYWSDEAYRKLAMFEVPLMGYEEGYYRNRPVERGVFAQAIAYVFGEDYTLENAIDYMFAKEITLGMKESGSKLERFNNEGHLTRVQAAVFFHRMYNKDMTEMDQMIVNVAEHEDSVEEKVDRAKKKVDGRSLRDNPNTKEREDRQDMEYGLEVEINKEEPVEKEEPVVDEDKEVPDSSEEAPGGSLIDGAPNDPSEVVEKEPDTEETEEKEENVSGLDPELKEVKEYFEGRGSEILVRDEGAIVVREDGRNRLSVVRLDNGSRHVSMSKVKEDFVYYKDYLTEELGIEEGKLKELIFNDDVSFNYKGVNFAKTGVAVIISY